MENKPFRLTSGMLAWGGLLGTFLLIGIVSAVYVFWNGLEVTNMSDSVPWGLWITIDLSSIALGAGAFTLSAVVYLFGLKKFQGIIRLAIFVGFIGYTSALLTLVMDIGRPDRFWHPWAYWNVHSVLWEITWCITIYLTIMIMEFLPVVAEAKFFDRWPGSKIANLYTKAHLVRCLAWASLCSTSLLSAPPTASSNHAPSGSSPACPSCSSSQLSRSVQPLPWQ
jgi:Ni/Fe-hydrogenase subunit HybB-like protein